MERISGHLPRLGALVLAIVVAAVAYAVYESGQSTGSDSASTAPRSGGLAALNPTNDSTKAAKEKPNSKPKPKTKSDPDSKRAHNGGGAVPIVASARCFHSRFRWGTRSGTASTAARGNQATRPLAKAGRWQQR